MAANDRGRPEQAEDRMDEFEITWTRDSMPGYVRTTVVAADSDAAKAILEMVHPGATLTEFNWHRLTRRPNRRPL